MTGIHSAVNYGNHDAIALGSELCAKRFDTDWIEIRVRSPGRICATNLALLGTYTTGVYLKRVVNANSFHCSQLGKARCRSSRDSHPHEGLFLDRYLPSRR
ncbi:MAG TPA: hypothetical protein VNT26_22090, partial [Candidatus Sulfotelmatobacter sp.]|nr:hypothetical protein [Candidatus Sulfotelmatobacter sp.]